MSPLHAARLRRLFHMLLLTASAAMALPAAAQVSAGAAGAADPAASGDAPISPFHVDGDGIAAPIGGAMGDAARGRAIVAERRVGLCLLCHAAPIPEQRFQGNIGPNLDGVGARWSVPQLRLRIVDARRLNPASIMPSYYRIDGLTRVAPAQRGKPILTAQQIEDVVAYLASLQAATVPDPAAGPGMHPDRKVPHE